MRKDNLREKSRGRKLGMSIRTSILTIRDSSALQFEGFSNELNLPAYVGFQQAECSKHSKRLSQQDFARALDAVETQTRIPKAPGPPSTVSEISLCPNCYRSCSPIA